MVYQLKEYSSTLAVSRVLMATADRMFYAGLDLPVQWWILYRGYGIAVLSVSVPKYTCTSTDKVCSALRYRNVDPLCRRYEYTGGFPHQVSATDTWCMLVGSCLQCRGAGQDRRVALATSAWFNKVQEDANDLLLSTGHGAAQRFTRTTRRRRWCWLWWRMYCIKNEG